MEITDFQVGDILSHSSWDDSFEVVGIYGNALSIKNVRSGLIITWKHYGNYANIEIERYGTSKSPIERKIARMYKRFEERNK